jgi:hypothetical protein
MSLEDDIDKAGKDQPFIEKTELESVMNSLDADTPDKSQFSNIDFNTRLTDFQISTIRVIDELQHLGILPEDSTICKTTKRLQVSLHGLGREEKVRIVQGQRDHQEGSGAMGKLRGLFTRQV